MLSKYSLPCCCIATKLSYLTRSNFHVISGGKTQDERFERTEQSVLPIDIKLTKSLQRRLQAVLNERMCGNESIECPAMVDAYSRIHFLPRVKSDEVLDLMQKSSVVLHPFPVSTFA